MPPGRTRQSNDNAKKNSENLHRKLSKLPAELVKDFDEALECAKEMGALKKTAEVSTVFWILVNPPSE